jgi:O-antigen ligase
MKVSIVVSSIIAISIILEYFEIIPFYSFLFSSLYDPSEIRKWKIYSFFGYQNIAAQYLIFTVLWGIGLIVSSNNSKTRIIALTCTMLSGTALLLTFCRGAIISVMSGLCLFLFFYKINKRKSTISFKKIRFVQAVCIFVATILVVLFLSNLLSDGKTARLISYMFERGDTARFTLWGDSMNMIQSNPFTGVGLGNYSIIYPLFKTGNWPQLTVYAHNEYLQIASEAGIIGFFGFMLFLIIAFKSSLRKIVNTPNHEEKNLLLSILFGCIATLIHSIFSYNLHSATSSYFFFVGLGILCEKRLNLIESQSYSRNDYVKNTIILSLVFVIALLGIHSEYKRINGHYHFSRAISHINENDNVAGVKHFTKAIEYQPYDYKYHVIISSTYRKTGNSKLAKEHFKKAQELAPYHYGSDINNK